MQRRGVRQREAGGALLYTEISNAISTEINAHYARLFSFFQQHPDLCTKPLYRKAILAHLPRLLVLPSEDQGVAGQVPICHNGQRNCFLNGVPE